MSLSIPPNNLEQLVSWIRTDLQDQLDAMQTQIAVLETFKNDWIRQTQPVVNDAVEILGNPSV